MYDMHLWSLTTGVPILSVHVDCAPGRNSAEITTAVTEVIKSFNIRHITVQVG